MIERTLIECTTFNVLELPGGDYSAGLTEGWNEVLLDIYNNTPHEEGYNARLPVGYKLYVGENVWLSDGTTGGLVVGATDGEATLLFYRNGDTSSIYLSALSARKIVIENGDIVKLVKLEQPQPSDHYLNKTGLSYLWQKVKAYITSALQTKQDTLVSGTNLKTVNNTSLLGNGNVDTTPAQATADILGVIKLNPGESITLNENGQLVVGGRLGQFTDGGLYYPTTGDPTNVGNYTLLISEAKGLSAAHRELIIAGGSTVNLKTTAQAGATQYRVANTQTNRFLCAGWVEGRLAVSESEAKNKTVAISSIKFANGNNISVYHGADETNNDIIITVSETLNPNGTLSSVRGYGTWKNADTISAGQGNRTGGGKIFQVGQGLTSDGNVNQIGMIGIRQYNTAGNSFMVGSDNINKKNFSSMFGQGIDNSNGNEGGAYFGTWPIVSSDTAFVVGNGTAYNAKSNLFEIKTNGDIYINGVKL